MPRFELRVDDELRFWSIERSKNTLRIRWGSGRREQARDIVCSTSEVDTKYAELVTKQRALGYAEVGAQVIQAPRFVDAEQWRGRFETDKRFLEITLDGALVSQRSGRINSSGYDARAMPAVESHGSPAAAREHAERVIGEAVQEGYRRVDPREQGPLALREPYRPATNAALEVQCRANPEDPAPWSVYSDWLSANGDVRGELAALRTSGHTTEAEVAFVKHQLAMFGDNVSAAAATTITRWRHGFPVAASIRIDDPDEEDRTATLHAVTAHFLGCQLAMFIESLRFGLAARLDNSWARTLAAVASAPSAEWIRELALDDYDDDSSQISWTKFGDLSKSLPRFPKLSSLTIRAGSAGKLGTLDLPALERFVRISCGISAGELSAICNAHWPTLRHLELWLGSRNHGAEASIASLQPILSGTGLPVLGHLGLVNSELADALIPALAESAILRQLSTLDLSQGTLSARGAKAFVKHAARFRHLAWVDLTSNLLGDDDANRIAASLANARVDRQRVGERYVVLGE